MRSSRLAILRQLLLASATTVATACVSTRVENGPVRASLPSNGRNGEVRLTLKNGTQVKLFHPRIDGDSVIGWSVASSEASEYRLAVAKDEVASVAVRHGDTFKTVLAVVGGTVAFTFIVALAACASLASTV